MSNGTGSKATGSTQQIPNGRWRTTVRGRDGIRRAADDVLGRGRRTYATKEEAQAVIAQALDLIEGQKRTVIVDVGDFDDLRREITEAREQLAASAAALDRLDAHIAALAG